MDLRSTYSLSRSLPTTHDENDKLASEETPGRRVPSRDSCLTPSEESPGGLDYVPGTSSFQKLKTF